MKFSNILAVATLILACGCRPAASDEVPATFTAASENGLAVGTITFDGEAPVNDIYRFFYEPVSGDTKFIKQNDGKIEIKARANNQPEYSGDFNNGKSYLFVINRPPGKYALTQYNYLDHIGPQGMVSNSKEFSLPFEIKKGTVTYLGDLNYDEDAAPGSPRIYIWDKYGRDMEQLKAKYPGIDWELAENKTIISGNNGGGVIEFMNK